MKKWIARVVLLLLGILLAVYWLPASFASVALRWMSGMPLRFLIGEFVIDTRDTAKLWLLAWKQPMDEGDESGV